MPRKRGRRGLGGAAAAARGVAAVDAPPDVAACCGGFAPALALAFDERSLAPLTEELLCGGGVRGAAAFVATAAGPGSRDDRGVGGEHAAPPPPPVASCITPPAPPAEEPLLCGGGGGGTEAEVVSDAVSLADVGILQNTASGCVMIAGELKLAAPVVLRVAAALLAASGAVVRVTALGMGLEEVTLHMAVRGHARARAAPPSSPRALAFLHARCPPPPPSLCARP